MSDTHAKSTVRRLSHRLRCFAYWRGTIGSWPGGLVPVGTAARMLGVSRTRLWSLIRAGRVPVFAMPTGSPADRLIPVDALMGLSSGADTGRGESWCAGETADRIGSVPRNPWAESTPVAREISQKGSIQPNTGTDFEK